MGLGFPVLLNYAGDKQSVVSTGEQECEVVFDIEMRLKGIFSLFQGHCKKPIR